MTTGRINQVTMLASHAILSVQKAKHATLSPTYTGSAPEVGGTVA